MCGFLANFRLKQGGFKANKQQWSFLETEQDCGASAFAFFFLPQEEVVKYGQGGKGNRSLSLHFCIAMNSFFGGGLISGEEESLPPPPQFGVETLKENPPPPSYIRSRLGSLTECTI